MPNDYDKFMRENMGRIFLPLIERFYQIEISELVDLPSSLVRTHHREPDFLKMVSTEQGERFILHIEYQSTNDPSMVYRMQSYHAMLMEKHRVPTRQFVFYLGTPPMQMRTRLHADEIMSGFEVIDFSQMDVNDFLHSENMELMMMAILTDFKGRDPNEVIREIVNNVLNSDRNEDEKGRILQQLTVIGNIRKLGIDIKNVLNNMPLTIDISQTWFYQKGEAKGIAKGEAKGIAKGIVKGEAMGIAKGEAMGIAKGIAKGEAKAKSNNAIAMLKSGELPIEKIALFSGLSVQEVLTLKAQIEQ